VKSGITEAKPKIKEAVVVEGRDDVEVVRRAVDAVCIPTHGFGIAAETWQLLDKAYDELGIIILTDPDHAGETIRKRLAERYPDARHAYLARRLATKDDDIGIENANPADVAEAILKAHASVNASAGINEKARASVTETVAGIGASAGTAAKSIGNDSTNNINNTASSAGTNEDADLYDIAAENNVSMELLQELGLSGGAGARELRAETARVLGIGYGNSKAFLRMLNGFGITPAELTEAVKAAQASQLPTT